MELPTSFISTLLLSLLVPPFLYHTNEIDVTWISGCLKLGTPFLPILLSQNHFTPPFFPFHLHLLDAPSGRVIFAARAGRIACREGLSSVVRGGHGGGGGGHS